MSTRELAARVAGTGTIFRDLAVGDRFYFPRSPQHVFTKRNNGWYTDGRNSFRTGPLTAVERGGQRHTCPECGSTSFTIDTKALKGETYHPGFHVIGRDLPMRMRPATVRFCNECEFCEEVRR